MDPHGTHFSDALPKLQGLARDAETHPKVYRRIEAVAEIGDKLRVLDLTDSAVRKEVAAVRMCGFCTRARSQATCRYRSLVLQTGCDRSFDRATI